MQAMRERRESACPGKIKGEKTDWERIEMMENGR
jgi:hypothetical protein